MDNLYKYLSILSNRLVSQTYNLISRTYNLVSRTYKLVYYTTSQLFRVIPVKTSRRNPILIEMMYMYNLRPNIMILNILELCKFGIPIKLKSILIPMKISLCACMATPALRRSWRILQVEFHINRNYTFAIEVKYYQQFQKLAL